MDILVEGTYVKRLCLRNFRNFEDLDLELGRGTQILVGPNAQGKTNFLEALYLAASTRLLRGQRDSEAIQESYESAQVTAELAPTLTTISVVLERSSRKKVSLNGLPLPRASDVLGRMPCVCISSEDLAIVRGEPSDRRLFLDLELSQVYPAYLRHLAGYKRALEQRNAALRAAQTSPVSDEVFESWECHLAAHGAELRQYRREFVSNLNPYAQYVHARMGAGEALDLAYQARDPAEDEGSFQAAYTDNRALEIARGVTTVGPHKDDLRVAVADREARLFGSQGQQRTAMLSIKLGTMEFERSERGFAPLLLLDDILSDLDESRRRRLMEWVLENAGQTVLTCTESSAVEPSVLAEAQVFSVNAGIITPA